MGFFYNGKTLNGGPNLPLQMHTFVLVRLQRQRGWLMLFFPIHTCLCCWILSVTGEFGSMTQSEFPRSISHTLLFVKCGTEKLISSTGIHNNSPNLYVYNRISFTDHSRKNYVTSLSFPVTILCGHILWSSFLVGNKLHNKGGSYPFIAAVRKGRTSWKCPFGCRGHNHTWSGVHVIFRSNGKGSYGTL